MPSRHRAAPGRKGVKPMPDPLARRLDEIDRRLKAIEEFVSHYGKKHIHVIAEALVTAQAADKKTKLLTGCIEDLKKMYYALSEFTDGLHADRVRFMDAYYEIFPKRA